MLVSLGLVLHLHLVRCVFFLKYCLPWGGMHVHMGLSSPLHSWQAVLLPPPGQGLGPSQSRLGNACFQNCQAATPSPSLSSLLSPPPQWPHGFLSKLRVFWCTSVWTLLAAIGVVREEEKMFFCLREREPGGRILWVENPQQYLVMPEGENWSDGQGWVVTEGVSAVEGTIDISSLHC